MEQASRTLQRRTSRIGEHAAFAADMLAVGVAMSLPWSTSASSILIVLWLLCVLPALDRGSLERTLMSPAGGLPVLLMLLAVIGTLWADVSWAERFHGLEGFVKLLLIPLVLARYRDSERGRWVVIGFLISCLLVLVSSAVTLGRPDWAKTPGVLVKDYITQSGEFVLCAFGLLGLAVSRLHRQRWLACGCLALAALFLAGVFFIATGRTSLVVILVLTVLFAFWNFGWRGIAGLAGAGVLAIGLWFSSAYLRTQVTDVFSEVEQYRTENTITRSGERLEFWRKSILFVAESALVGNGTGTIADRFRRSAVAQTGASGQATVNPHSQTFAVAIQLGLFGVAVLYAIWFAHLRLFRGGGIVAWLGLIMVVQNVVGSLFNSHLFDFVQGWTYVFGIGVLGGMMLRQAGLAEGRLPLTKAAPQAPL
jgi:O-antigen ligase